MNANQKIQRGKRRAERAVLRRIRHAMDAGCRWNPLAGLTPRPWRNAIDRLLESGRIRFVKTSSYLRNGYEVVRRGGR